MNTFNVPVILYGVRTGVRKDGKGSWYALDFGDYRCAFVDKKLYDYLISCTLSYPVNATIDCHLERSGYKIDFVNV